MPSITIKNIPDKIYDRIKESAKVNRRSINNEIIYQLERNLLAHRVDEAEYRYRALELHTKASGSLTPEEIKHAINRDRDDSL